MRTRLSFMMWVFVPLTGLITTACGDSPTESPGVQFAVLTVGARVDSIPPLVLNTGPGELELTGSMVTPCDRYDASGELAESGDTLMATVTAFGVGQCIFDIGATLMYRFSLTRLEPEGYHLIVVHSYRGTFRPDLVALDTMVIVF